MAPEYPAYISLPTMRVVRALGQLETWRGLPQAIRLDNGPELTSQYLQIGAKTSPEVIGWLTGSRFPEQGLVLSVTNGSPASQNQLRSNRRYLSFVYTYVYTYPLQE